MTGEKLYIDTNVLRDAIEGRKNMYGKDIGTPALTLLKTAASCRYNLIVSEWTFEELNREIQLETLRPFLSFIEKKTENVPYTDQDVEQAKNLSSKNADDGLHVILAERFGADVIVTRNVEHFKDMTNLPVKKPEWV